MVTEFREEKYQTGDRHPVHRRLGLVEYDTDGVAVWTSIAEDKSAPCRLAKENAQGRLAGKPTYRDIPDSRTEFSRGQESRLVCPSREILIGRHQSD